MDIWDKEKRSAIMASVKQKDTKQEVLVRKYLFSRGFRFRKNDKRLPCSPDIVLPKYKVAIFIHGCFWHGHDCRAGHLPSSNNEFWTAKIERNRERDRKKEEQLRVSGWNVIVVWQCELKNTDSTKARLEKLEEEIRMQ
jgi:DNA mismatch endonuclease (patch repair protein)